MDNDIVGYDSFHDVGVDEITEPSCPLEPPWPPGVYHIEAVVKNYGTFNGTDFNVNVKIWDISQEDDGGTLYYEDNSLVTTSMAPGDEITVVFTDVEFYDILPLCIHNVIYRMEVTTELSGDEVSENDQKVMFFTIGYSSLPPIPEFDGIFGDNGWYVSCVTITFIDRYPYADYVTYYRLNGGAWTNYTETFVVTEDGTYMLYYYSLDCHENMVGEGEVSFKIDQTPPVISNVALTTSDPLDTEPGFGWENVSCIVTDNEDVDEVEIHITYPDLHTEQIPMIKNSDTYSYETTLTDAGDYTYHIWADDTAGNENESIPETFILPPNYEINLDYESRVIDFWDIVRDIRYYGGEGPPGWIRADVDNNGIIDFWDLVKIVKHYGETW